MDRDPNRLAEIAKQEQKIQKVELFDRYREILQPIENKDEEADHFVRDLFERQHSQRVELKKESLEIENFISAQDFEDTIGDKKMDLGFCRVKTDAIIGSVSPAFKNWSSEYSSREGQIERIATELRDTQDPQPLNEIVERIFHVQSQKQPIRLNLFHGPNGPIFMVEEGTHRVAACKLAKTDSVLAEVSESKEPQEIWTTESYRANDWKKMIERGLIEGNVDEYEGKYYLDMNKQVIPWCHRERNHFFQMNNVYKNVYENAFENITSFHGEKIPKEVFLDTTGIALNLFLHKPEELSKYVAQLKKK